jgi:hypothetical protein
MSSVIMSMEWDCLWTAATNWPIVYPLDDIGLWVWRDTVGWYWQGKSEELGNELVPTPLCPPQNPHGLTRAPTRASAVRSWRLTAWAMARPTSRSHHHHQQQWLYSPCKDLGRLTHWGFVILLLRHAVGLLWTSDQQEYYSKMLVCDLLVWGSFSVYRRTKLITVYTYSLVFRLSRKNVLTVILDLYCCLRDWEFINAVVFACYLCSHE